MRKRGRKSWQNYDYEIVNGRKIRVRPKETVSEIDKNGYFRRQPNHFTTPFGDGENDLKAEGNKRYRLVWAKLCHWSNRAAIVRELEGPGRSDFRQYGRTCPA